MLKRNERGFGLADVIILVVVVGALGFVGTRVAQTVSKSEESPTKTVAKETVTWEFNSRQSKWTVKGTPPKCPSPLLAQSPVDTKLATSVLYPGQYRDKNYKPHGGFRFDNSQSDDIQVTMPMDAELINASRYIESGEVQYLLTFRNPCGVDMRFDHLAALSPRLEVIMSKLPAPKENDSRTTRIVPTVAMKRGEVLATAVGFKNTNNVSMDFGVYDLLSPNEISKNSTWAELHDTDKDYAWFGTCWFDMLPKTDADVIKSLIEADDLRDRISDYCFLDGGTTLNYNSGKPV